MDSQLLEWFRVDQSRRTTRLLVSGTLLVFVGASLVGGAFLTHKAGALLHALTLLGAAMLLLGLVVGFGGMTVLLAHDEYLAVTPDGILFHRGANDELHPWGELTGVTHDEAGGRWVLHRADGTAVPVDVAYSGASARELAAHLEQLRAKASLAPLTAPDVASIALGQPHRRG